MCIFCKIANGEIPSYKVYEDDDFLAFLDISQATIGHTLVIPKNHINNFLTAENSTISKAYVIASKVAHALKKSLNVHDFNILSNCGEKAGQTIDHFHIHIIPRYDGDDLKIEFSKHELLKSDFEKIAVGIKNAL